MSNRFNLDFLSKRAGQITTIGALLIAVWLFVFPLVEGGLRDNLRAWIEPESAFNCVMIPASGHFIESASAGEWATITWRDIKRTRRNCGAPDLTAVVVNGDGVFHNVDLSISGVALEEGTTSELKYKFKIPDSAKAGNAWFRVTLDFHEDGRTINSPRVFFTILPKDQG